MIEMLSHRLPEATALNSDALALYRELMIDTKRRSDFIGLLNTVLPHNIGWLESVCLQIRKQLENIAFSCLVANSKHMPTNIKKKYKPEDILSLLDRHVFNDDPEQEDQRQCWPEPVLTNKPKPADRHHPQDAGTINTRPPGDWLTRDEVKRIYGRLGDLLHNRNPLREGSVDTDYFFANVLQWHYKIIGLLTKHKIALQGDEEMYLVQTSPDGVTITPFVKMERSSLELLCDLTRQGIVQRA